MCWPPFMLWAFKESLDFTASSEKSAEVQQHAMITSQLVDRFKSLIYAMLK